MKDVRDLCSLKRVQDYHKKFYHLRNMWILLCGTIDTEQMLKNIDILDAAQGNTPPATFDRPFINMTAPDLTSHRSKATVVRGPSECENEGSVAIGFLAKPAWVSQLNFKHSKSRVSGHRIHHSIKSFVQLFDLNNKCSIAKRNGFVCRSLLRLGFNFDD